MPPTKSETLNPEPPNNVQGDEAGGQPHDGGRRGHEPFKSNTIDQLNRTFIIMKPELKAHNNHDGCGNPEGLKSGLLQ
jgi:hypothetical protein